MGNDKIKNVSVKYPSMKGKKGTLWSKGHKATDITVESTEKEQNNLNEQEIEDLSSDKFWDNFGDFSKEDWCVEQKRDPILGRLIELMNTFGDICPNKGVLRTENKEIRRLAKQWSMLCFDKDGILCRRVDLDEFGMPNNRIYQRLVPYAWQMHIFRRIHGKECIHLSYDRVYPMIWQRFFWNNMSENILKWLKACKSCQKAKTGSGASKMPLRTDFVSHPMDRLGMDLQGPFNTSLKGNKYCLQYWFKTIFLNG